MLPEEIRPRYAVPLNGIAAMALQFLLTFEYDQGLMDGPLFTVTEEKVRRCYGER